MFCYVYAMVTKKIITKKTTNDINLNTKKLVQDEILDVNFDNGKKANVIVYIVDKKGLSTALKSAFGKQLKAEIDNNKFEAKTGKFANLGYINNQKIIIAGFGEEKQDGNNTLHKAKKNITLEVQKLGAKILDCLPSGYKIEVAISNIYTDLEDKMLVEIYFGLNQKKYNFNKYFTDKKILETQKQISNIVLIGKKTSKTNISNDIKKLITERQNQLEGIFYVRTLGNEPSNVIYPATFVSEIKNAFTGVKNIKIKVLEKQDLEKLGMNMLLGVAQGSVKEPKVLVVEYRGNPKQSKIDLALIGKGVCFDSGGLSLKPSQYMEGMKADMLGATTVMSSLLTMAKNNVKANIVAVGGMVENMPDGNAQKVGDIVKSMSGKTVEIIDTDAEGRLVLGDILYYAQSTYKPEYMIDMATLTGAIMVALGTEKAGIFTNDENLGKKLYESGEKTGEHNWIMPLTEEYFDAIKSKIADIRNLGKTRYAGSATAASFLANFIGDNKKWAHIDIAGVDEATSNNVFAKEGLCSGYGVKLLSDFVKTNIEK